MTASDEDLSFFIAWTPTDRLLQFRNEAAETFLPRYPARTLELLRSGTGVCFADNGGQYPRQPDPDFWPTVVMLRLLYADSHPEGRQVQVSTEVLYEGKGDEPKVTLLTLSDSDRHWLNALSDERVADCLNREALKRGQAILAIEHELEQRRLKEVAIGAGMAAASIVYEPVDWIFTFSVIAQDPSNPLAYAGLLPLVSANSCKLIGSPNAAVIHSFEDVTRQNASKLSTLAKAADECVAPRGIVLRNLGDDVVGELFDGQKLEKILANHLENGGSLVTGDEAVRMLKDLDAQAAYLPRAGGPGTLVIGPNASRLQVIEELIHHGQYRRIGFPELDSVKGAFVGARFEIEAQDTLLSIARRKGWTQAEIDLIQRNRAAWVNKLQELTERYGHGY